MNLNDKLNAAMIRASLREFEVTITETLQKKVTVTARNQLDAERFVQNDWYDSVHILDSSHFTDVSFDVTLVNKEISLGNKGKEDAVL